MHFIHRIVSLDSERCRQRGRVISSKSYTKHPRHRRFQRQIMAYDALAKRCGFERQASRGNRNWPFCWTSHPSNSTNRQITCGVSTKYNILSPSRGLRLLPDCSILFQLRTVYSLHLLPLALLDVRIYQLLCDATQDSLFPQSKGTRSKTSRKSGERSNPPQKALAPQQFRMQTTAHTGRLLPGASKAQCRTHYRSGHSNHQ